MEKTDGGSQGQSQESREEVAVLVQASDDGGCGMMRSVRCEIYVGWRVNRTLSFFFFF